MASLRTFLLVLLAVLALVTVVSATECTQEISVSVSDINNYRASIDTTNGDRKAMKYWKFNAVGSTVTANIKNGGNYKLYLGNGCMPTSTNRAIVSMCGGNATLEKSTLLDSKIYLGVEACDPLTAADTVVLNAEGSTVTACFNAAEQQTSEIRPADYCAGFVVRLSCTVLVVALFISFLLIIPGQ
jgi:hypothetical protein